jgi:hypothetical protein
MTTSFKPSNELYSELLELEAKWNKLWGCIETGREE